MPAPAERSGALEARPFEPHHAGMLPEPIAWQSASYLESMLRSESWRDVMLPFARTIFCGDTALAAWGLLPIHDGVMSAWAWISRPCRPYRLSLVRLAREQAVLARKKYGIARVQAAVSCDLPEAVRFAEACGFEIEGRMRRFGLEGVGDYFLLARVF